VVRLILISIAINDTLEQSHQIWGGYYLQLMGPYGKKVETWNILRGDYTNG